MILGFSYNANLAIFPGYYIIVSAKDETTPTASASPLNPPVCISPYC